MFSGFGFAGSYHFNPKMCYFIVCLKGNPRQTFFMPILPRNTLITVRWSIFWQVFYICQRRTNGVESGKKNSGKWYLTGNLDGYEDLELRRTPLAAVQDLSRRFCPFQPRFHLFLGNLVTKNRNDTLFEEPGHNDQDCFAQWKQIKNAQLLTRNSFTVCPEQQKRLTVGRTQQPELQKCPDIRHYIVSTSHSPPTFQMESHRFLCKTMTKDPKPMFPSSDSPLSASPMPCIFASNSAVASPAALASLSPGSEALLQLISLNQQTSWCTSHLRLLVPQRSRFDQLISLLSAAQLKFPIVEQEDVSGIQRPVSQISSASYWQRTNWSFCLTNDCPDGDRTVPSSPSHAFHRTYNRSRWGFRKLSMDLADVNNKMARCRPAIHSPVWPVSAPSVRITATRHA